MEVKKGLPDRNGVKVGYKQTEVGVIPEDWDSVKLAKVAEIDPENLSSSTNPEYQFQYISLEDVDYGCLRNTRETIFRVAPSRARRRIKKDDILFATVRPNLKSHYLVTEDVSDWICSTGFSVIRCNSNQAEPKYIYNHLFAYAVNKQIDSLIAGSNYPAINSKDVKSFTIPLPPTKAEQTAIAAALSDADALIQSLEKLIAKKRLIKQGAMQELLKPREGWVVKKLGEVADISKLAGFEYSKYFNSYNDAGDIVVIRGTNITNNRLDLSDIKTIPRSTSNKLQRSKLKKDDLVFAYVGTIGPVYLIEESDKYHLGPNTARITVNKDVFPGFALCYFTSSYIKNEIIEHTSIGAQPSLSMTKIRSFKIPLPPTNEEQTRIATILADMDSEISALETKLAKYKQVKQGMMQNLLTGKIRLV